MTEQIRSFETAAERWAGVGPYYAMFPIGFADAVITKYSEPGDVVLDPFAGRGTSVFSAATHARTGIGVEVNPVGWVYARAKLAPAVEDNVVERLKRVAGQAQFFRGEADRLPDFFFHCFSSRVRRFLVAARATLDWTEKRVDRTLMALLLVYLHGKKDAALSNQMRQTKSMAPDYAVRWWRDRQMRPPRLDPVEFLTPRIKWRYKKGLPSVSLSSVHLGDSVKVLPLLAHRLRHRARLLFTSPPYYGVTNYHYDQWLRLWLLGAAPNALRPPDSGDHQKKFEDREKYKNLLKNVFESSAAILNNKAIVYVRTDKRELTYEATKAALKSAFPSHRLTVVLRPFLRPTQTSLFGDAKEKDGEVDMILHPAVRRQKKAT
jgi:hypothetical protein